MSNLTKTRQSEGNGTSDGRIKPSEPPPPLLCGKCRASKSHGFCPLPQRTSGTRSHGFAMNELPWLGIEQNKGEEAQSGGGFLERLFDS